MIKLKAIYASCCLVLVVALAGVVQESVKQPGLPIVPPDHVTVALYEPDYQEISKAFQGAEKAKSIRDGAVRGLWVVKLKPTLARRLMLTIFNAQQGIPDEAPRK